MLKFKMINILFLKGGECCSTSRKCETHFYILIAGVDFYIRSRGIKEKIYFGASEGTKKNYPGNGKTALALELEGNIDHTAFSVGN